MQKTELKVNPEWEKLTPAHDVHVPCGEDFSIAAFAQRQTESLYARFAVWVDIHKILNIIFPLPRLTQRMLDRRPVEPPFLAPPPDLLPDRAQQAARLCALRVFREENNLPASPRPPTVTSALND
jgi:hypothetical protein